VQIKVSVTSIPCFWAVFYDDDNIFVICNWVVTRWQKYSTHLHTNNTKSDTKQTIHRTTQQFWKSAGHAPSWLVIPVCPKSNANDLKLIFLLNIHAITVYPLQNRLLVIEYSDSSIAATLHSSGGSLHLRCCSKPSSQLPGRFQPSQNDVL